MKQIVFIVFCLILPLTSGAQTQSKVNELFLKAQELDGQHNYVEAVKLYEQAEVEIIKENRKDSVVYANCWTNIGRCYFMLENYKKAADAFEVSLPRYEKFSDRWGKVVEWLAFCYTELSDAQNQARMMALMDENNKHELTLPCDEPGCMTERAQYYAAVGETANAKEWFQKALDMLDQDTDETKELNEQKVKTYEGYAKFLGDNMEDYASGADYYIMAAIAQKVVDGVNESYYTMMYSAGIYSYLGKQYQQAVECYDKVVLFYQGKSSDVAKNNLAKVYRNMGNAYSAMKDYDNAIMCYTKNLEHQQATDTMSEDYAKALERVATAEKFAKQYDASIEHYKQAIAMYQQLGNTEEARNVGNSLSLCYAYAGRTEQVDTSEDEAEAEQEEKLKRIIKEEVENLELTRTYLGELTYANSLATIAGSYYMLEEYDDAVSYYEKYMESIRSAISKEFSMKSETERMMIWEKEKGNIEEILDMMVALPTGMESLLPRVAALAYDVELLSKGILLKSSIEFEKVLKLINDKTLLSNYETVKRNSEKINSLRVSASSDADLENILALERKNETLLMSVMKKCNELGGYTNYLSYSWKDVQKSMNATDVAIEFAAVKYDVFDVNNFMVAIVLTKDMQQPTAFPICNLQVAQTMMNDSLLFETELAGNVVWGGFLKQYIEGKKRVLFSADGSFNSVGIEYLLYNGKPLSEQYEVYRLSSTKEICYQHRSNSINNVALFGNIDYWEDGALSKKSEKAIRSMQTTNMRTENSANFSVNGRFSLLDNTEVEIAAIENILKKAKVKNPKSFTGIEASEEAFLKLTDSDVNVLHVATHGTSDSDKKSTDAESMQHCALAFAGANLHEEADSINGLVTAAEVSKMNLRNCDLAVLSACETALGKISDDGVFGLQRGFKNAGVNSLLMSLKSVYDNSTKDLMIAFYRNLMSGMSKRNSLVEAQSQIRKQYRDGRYWAPFILLDALE